MTPNAKTPPNKDSFIRKVAIADILGVFSILMLISIVSMRTRVKPYRLLFLCLIIFLLSGAFIIRHYRQKRCEILRQDLISRTLADYGVHLEDSDITADIPVNRFSLCFVRGLLIFMASFGTIGGLVTSFDLSFQWQWVVPAILFVSMLAAFLYYNKIAFYLGYFGIFFLFTAFAFSLYPYINSGFQAFINTVYQKYGDFFFLSTVREANELIANRYLTVSIAMVFVALMMAILLNITISARMNLTETFLLTFLPLQIAFYIDRMPAVPYLAMLLAVYITVGILGRSDHYQMSLNLKKESFFRQRPLKKRLLKKKNDGAPRYFSYQSSSRAILTLSLYSMQFCFIFLLLCSLLFFSGMESKGISNRLKNTTDAYVKTFVQNGLWGFFDRYDATGGLSHGKLGGVSGVSPDYQTDLEVTFVPYTTDTVYLKGYTGVHYSNNIFAADYHLPDTVPMSGSLADECFARMSITPVDPDSTVAAEVFPYDTLHSSTELFSHSSSSGSFFIDEPATTLSAMDSDAYAEAFQLWDSTMADYAQHTPGGAEHEYYYELLYIPYVSRISYEPNPAITEEYESMVYDNYLEVPEQLEDVISDFCDEAGLTDLLRDNGYDLTYEGRQQLRLRIANNLKMYFAREFPYTMSPGTTPRDRDVIEYFLTVQRRGYCAHFASSATLILRHMGIPARYIEGYCIQPNDLLEAEALSTDTSEWYIGENGLYETGLVKVDVTDASAHAWVEIYLDGYGWIPFEMTPPAFGEEMNNAGFLALFSGLFTPVQRLAGNTGNIAPDAGLNLPGFSFASSFGFMTRPLFFILLVLTLTIAFIALRRTFKERMLLSRTVRKGDYSAAVVLTYRGFVRRLQKKHYITEEHPLIRDIKNFLIQSFQNTAVMTDSKKSSAPSDVSAESIEEFARLAEQAAFSEERLSKEQYEAFCGFIKTFSLK